MAEQGCQEAAPQLLRNTLPERLRQCERAGRRAAILSVYLSRRYLYKEVVALAAILICSRAAGHQCNVMATVVDPNRAR